MTSWSSMEVSSMTSWSSMEVSSMTTPDSAANHTTHNATVTHPECLVVYKDFEYLPWDNPGNVISLETGSKCIQGICGVFMPLLAFFAIPTNVLNALVFWRQGLSERINFLLFSLSVADLVVVMYMLLLSSEYFYTLLIGQFQLYGPLSVYIANNNLNVLYGFVYVSGFISTLIAVERCICITRPFTAKKILKTRTAAIIVLVSVVVLEGTTLFVSNKYKVLCEFYPEKGFTLQGYYPSQFYLDNQAVVDFFNAVVFGLLLPTLFLVTTGVSTAVTAVKLKLAAEWRSGQTTGGSGDSKEVGVTRMLVAVSCVFIACTLPNTAARILPFFMPEFRLGGRQQNLLILAACTLHALPTINSSLNFFFYVRMGSRYRQTLRSLFCLARAGKAGKEKGVKGVKETVDEGNTTSMSVSSMHHPA